MIRCLIHIILVTIWLPLFSQESERFNNIYPHEGSQNIRSVLTTETGYLLVSESFLDGVWGAQIVGLDYYGQESFFRHVLFASNGHGIGLNSVKKDSSGNNWICGFINTGEDSSQGYIFGFTDEGDSLTLIKSISQTQGFQDLIPVSDGFVVIGKDWENGSSLLHLTKLDLNGNVLWERKWNQFSNRAEYGYVLNSAPDGGYVIGCDAWDYAWDSAPWIIKTDSMGNMEWNRLINNSQWNDGYAAIHIGSDGFIYVGCGSGKGLNGHSQTINKNYFAKISLDNELIWEREFGPLNESNPIGQLKEDRHGNIIGITDVYFDVYHGGLLLKVSPDGDSLWSKSFMYSYDSSLVGRNYCWSMDTTLDGGIITGGFVQMFDTNGGDPFQDVWAVKFDSNGCFDNVYSCPVGIEEISQAEYQELRIWPNPNDGLFQMEQNIQKHRIEIWDVLGNQVAFTISSLNKIELVDAKAGLYVICYRNKDIIHTQKILVTYER